MVLVVRLCFHYSILLVDCIIANDSKLRTFTTVIGEENYTLTVAISNN